MENLPIDILENIGKRLNDKTGVSLFRAVCKSWRSSIPASQIKPPIRVCIENRGTLVLNLIESVVYGLVKPPATQNPSVACSNPCSLVVKIRQSDQEIRVLRAHPLSSLPCPRAINLLDFRVLELGKTLGDPNFPDFRAAISSSPDWPAVMVVAENNLYYCRLDAGVEIEKCTLVNDTFSARCYRFSDVVFYKGMFYALDNDITVAIDSSLELKFIAHSPVGRKLEFCCSSMHLVESLGELLLVNKYMRFDSRLENVVPSSFDVYKLNVPEKKWVLMRSLNDEIIFLGDHFDDGCFQFAASAQGFPGFQRNYIYFSQNKFLRDMKMEGKCRYPIRAFSSFSPHSELGVDADFVTLVRVSSSKWPAERSYAWCSKFDRCLQLTGYPTRNGFE